MQKINNLTVQFPTIHRGNIWKNYQLFMSKNINKREKKKRLVCKTSGLYHLFIFFSSFRSRYFSL